MIVEAIVGALAALVGFVIELLPNLTLPPFLTGTGPDSLYGIAGEVGTAMAAFSTWLPVTALTNVIGLLGASLAFALAVRVLRIVISFFTGGGGGA